MTPVSFERLVSPASFAVVAAMTESVCHLPAVATLDWSDRAAEALAKLATPSRACVLVCSVDGHGAVLHHEATGVAINAMGLVSSPVSVPVSNPAGGEDPQIDLKLRARSERLDSIGFRLREDQAETGLCDTLDRLLHTPEWRTRGIGRLWAGVPAGEVVLAMQRLDEHDPHRVMIAMVGVRTPESEQERYVHLSQLSAVMPRLVARAVLAMGTRRTTASSWLTSREQQVLDQLALGRSVREIADIIGRSPHTVHDHVKSLHRKLNASSRGELVARALGHLDNTGRAVKPAEASSDGPRVPEIGTARVDADELRRPAPPAPVGLKPVQDRIAPPGVSLPPRRKASSLYNESLDD